MIGRAEINLGGQMRPIAFTKGAMMVFAKCLDPNFYEASTPYAAVFAGIWGAEYETTGKCLTLESDVRKWVEDMPKEEMAKVDEAMSISTAYIDLIKQANDLTQATKKKQAPKKRSK